MIDLKKRKPMELNKYLFEHQIYKQDFCKILNISGTHLSLISNHKRNPSFKLIKLIDKATGGKVTAKDWKKKKQEDK